jgi:hypothetical protein
VIGNERLDSQLVQVQLQLLHCPSTEIDERQRAPRRAEADGFLINITSCYVII